MLRDGDGGRGGGAHLVFAYYINSHDVGQATRALQVCGLPLPPSQLLRRLRLTCLVRRGAVVLAARA